MVSHLLTAPDGTCTACSPDEVYDLSAPIAACSEDAHASTSRSPDNCPDTFRVVAKRGNAAQYKVQNVRFATLATLISKAECEASYLTAYVGRRSGGATSTLYLKSGQRGTWKKASSGDLNAGEEYCSWAEGAVTTSGLGGALVVPFEGDEADVFFAIATADRTKSYPTKISFDRYYVGEGCGTTY